MDAIELGLFAGRISSICDEMGAVLRSAAFSPNIRDRLDYSCAIFDAAGQLCAQAAHIPVHLGSMAYAMQDIVNARDWRAGDMLVVNDPYQGGTHLPDVTLVAPVFDPDGCIGFVANRAHHADIGCDSPGSMPIGRQLEDEGLLITPTLLLRDGEIQSSVMRWIVGSTHNQAVTEGDFSAQISANRTGARRLKALAGQMGTEPFRAGLDSLNDYAERMARLAIEELPDGTCHFSDYMEDDGLGTRDIVIRTTVEISGDRIRVDFSGTHVEVAGNINCPVSVAAAAVYYVFRCLTGPGIPACAGGFRPITLQAEAGSLVNARPPAAVTAGNVETSSRIVDCLLGALAELVPERVAAASQGTMNNLALGARTEQVSWDYYETLAGGMGAGRGGGGLDAVHTHMTNTLNTPIEILESNFPLRIRRYAVRPGSGGAGRREGGSGLVREYEFLHPAQLTLITERRRRAPWGLSGGEPGQPGKNLLNGQPLEAKTSVGADDGDVLTIETPGGGGYGRPE